MQVGESWSVRGSYPDPLLSRRWWFTAEKARSKLSLWQIDHGAWTVAISMDEGSFETFDCSQNGYNLQDLEMINVEIVGRSKTE